MKVFFGLILLLVVLNAEEIEGYATVGMVSHHFGTKDSGERYNGNHDAYGAEIVYDKRLTLAYLHFVNSRDKDTDIVVTGYRYDIYKGLGIYGVVGYQKGYCFDGLKSVECTEGKDNDGFAFMPILYYRHQYFTVDLITQGTMVALKLNIKLFSTP